MIYPFIYTRTKYHDFRVVTYNQVSKLPNEYIIQCRSIACAAINASTTQLSTPTWILVKNKELILWGIACSNSLLGHKSDDEESRPVRGFFGIIIKGKCGSLPFGMSFFKQLYDQYVTPIWEALSSSKEVSAPFDIAFGEDIIHAAKAENEINYDTTKSAIFPWRNNFRGLFETILSDKGNNSLAVNIHDRCQAIFGNFSFMNVIMSHDSNQKIVEYIPIKGRVDKSQPDKSNLNNQFYCYEEDANSGTQCEELSSPSENHLNPNEKLLNKCYLKYGVYIFLVLICLLFVVKGPSIWEKILLSKQPQEKEFNCDRSDIFPYENVNKPSPFLITRKPMLNVSDVEPGEVYEINYESSSKITRVSTSDSWIRIITPLHQLPQSGIIKIIFTPLANGERKGAIYVYNKEGKKLIVPVSQTTSVKHDNGVNGTGTSYNGDKKSSKGPNAILINRNVSEETKPHPNGVIESTETVESIKH